MSGETSEVMAGVQWLADHGFKVINMSLGGGDRSQAEAALYNKIRNAGTLIVVASGNDSSKKVSIPGRVPERSHGRRSPLQQPARVVLKHRRTTRRRRTGRQQPVVVPDH